MPIDVTVASFGSEAFASLRAVIAGAQRGDQLAPVTVVAPSNYASLSLRRQLARESPVVNIRFFGFNRLAELLGAPRLSHNGLDPLTPWIRAEAVRSALNAHVRAHPGSVFAAVSAHLATGEGLEATFRDLREASAGVLERLESSGPRAAEVVAVFRRFRQLSKEHYYDDTDLAHAAATAVRAGSPALRDLGHVVLYLPRDISAAEGELVAALGEAGLVTVILGATGDATADANLSPMRARLAGGGAQQMPLAIAQVPSATHIVAVPDADEEVRTAIRMAMARAASGTPLWRMAFLYPNADVYGPLVHERLEAAGIPHNGPPVVTLGQSITGRFLLGMLRLPAVNFRRDAVMDWLTAGPVVETVNGGIPPTNAWDTITREAGVVAGIEQWTGQLERHVRRLEGRLHDPERSPSEGEAAFVERQVGLVRRLGRFIEGLAGSLKRPEAPTWKAHGESARALLDRYMGNHPDLTGCPDDAHRDAESELRDKVLDAIHDLQGLDAVGVGDNRLVSAATFVQALERLLDSKPVRVGPFGTGIFSTGIANATGMDFDAVFVLGMVEGLMPSIGRDDPLLPDYERVAADPALPLRSSRRREERQDYLAALASASASGAERILVTSAADLRGQQKHLPSRWLLDTAGRLRGTPVALATNDFLALQSTPWLTRVASFQSAVQDSPEPGLEQEYDLRLMLSGRAGQDALRGIEPGMKAGMAATLSRAGRALGRFDGAIGARAEVRPGVAKLTSPTALQTWATCPFRYFLKSVLQVREREDPEDILVLNAAERGTIIHDALDQFMKANEGREGEWESRHLQQLLEIGEARCQQAEREGITGKPLLWNIERQRIRRDLEGFIEADTAQRAESGYRFAAGEHSFGMKPGGAPPVSVELLDGSSIAFRGSIDRVDGHSDGRLAVYDYKTGSTISYKGLEEDHLKGGQLLQLPIYALAALRDFGQASATVWASYWFVTRKGEYKHAGYEVTPEDLLAFRRTLQVIAEGIGGGVFPANPGLPETRYGGSANCNFCPYKRLCPSDRQRAWRRKQSAPEIMEYLALSNGAPHDDD